jgi:hypothetical protein
MSDTKRVTQKVGVAKPDRVIEAMGKFALLLESAPENEAVAALGWVVSRVHATFKHRHLVAVRAEAQHIERLKSAFRNPKPAPAGKRRGRSPKARA